MSKGEKTEEGLMSPKMVMPMKKQTMKGMDMAAKKKGKGGKGGGKKGC